MTLRLRNDQGRFVSDANESAYMNDILRALAGGSQPMPAPEPTPTTHDAGNPVPPVIPPVQADDNAEMNQLLRQFCGIYNDSR